MPDVASSANQMTIAKIATDARIERESPVLRSADGARSADRVLPILDALLACFAFRNALGLSRCRAGGHGAPISTPRHVVMITTPPAPLPPVPPSPADALTP